VAGLGIPPTVSRFGGGGGGVCILLNDAGRLLPVLQSPF